MSLAKSYAINFASFIKERATEFTGRDWVFDKIDAWLNHVDGACFFLLTGEPGSGKTAIAARLAQFSAGQADPPAGSGILRQGFLNAVHFCRATAHDWTDPRTFARSISLQLAGIPEFALALKEVGDKDINISVEQKIGVVADGGIVAAVQIENLVIRGLSGQEAFNRVVLDPLRTTYNAGYKKSILILVDSLDEALASTTDVTIVNLLTGLQGLDKCVRFILTSRAEPRVEDRFLVYAPDGLSLSDPAYAAENNKDIAAYVEGRFETDDKLKPQAAALGPVQVAEVQALITSKADGNFQYVAFLLRAIAEGQQALGNLAGLPFGLDALYSSSLERVVKLGKKTWNGAYRPLLGVLSVAQAPLSLAQLEIYAKLPGKAWDILMDLWQFIETTPGNKPATNGEEADDRYRLYHQSVIDFLRRSHLVTTVAGKRIRKPNRFWTESKPWHERVVTCCKGKAPDWGRVDWSKVDPYGLRYLVAHLHQLREDTGFRADVHRLVQTQPFIDRRLQGSANPTPVLDDLRLALELALDENNWTLTWQHILGYRRVLREQSDFEHLEEVVRSGDYAAAMERTALYGPLPNSQALTRLWIAWHAAASGHPLEVLDIPQEALRRQSPRGTASLSTRKADEQVAKEVGNAVAETLRRLLVRITRSVGSTSADQEAWLKKAVSVWPEAAATEALQGLAEEMDTWGDIVEAANLAESMQDLLNVLKANARIDADMSDPYNRGMVYLFQRKLAAGLFRSRDDQEWLDYVRQAVALVERDDYPSYREMALAWLAVGVLTQKDDKLARTGLATVLGGMFRPSPGFWGDTVAAAIDGMERANKQEPNPSYLLNLLEHVEATGERGIDPTVDRKLSEVVRWRERIGLPADPWSFGIRRRSAVAAVLHRRGDDHSTKGAEALLEQACAEGYWGSYAGFRAPARLSLACRWLEWRQYTKAEQQVEAARADADHVRDLVLRDVAAWPGEQHEGLAHGGWRPPWSANRGRSPCTVASETRPRTRIVHRVSVGAVVR